MDYVIDYIISLTHLYGLVHKEKVVEIYNMQNVEKIDEKVIDAIENSSPDILRKNFVMIQNDYFVAESIIQFSDMDDELQKRAGKPFYVPNQEELFNYKSDTYFEMTKEYKALNNYVKRNFFHGDPFKAEMFCEDIQGICQYAFSLQRISNEINQRGIVFESERQFNELMKLIMNLSNHTRLWENNGYTPQELFELTDKPNMRSLPANNDNHSNQKVGRNAPCPCGSGKKYKKCCMKN
ncbi:YecA family protein [Lederbergia panacisoli]|uniref:YecA family protein n=1 Tax=Lederbergia panacisoli TaxID=1255251 RepID=UPI00214B4B46|nr:SEC-C metal-binding domain-containing protein [Lederbergia panacisoli]MCR2823799.1 SEC-C metal-binding domain-containing protein [Lederbergia panacisoli]